MLMMKTKRQRTIVREKEVERDRLSELPDCVLLYMMEFMDTEDAVQTCILSKRWKDLWKRLTSLSFNSLHFRRDANFSEFVSQILSGRDGSISLLNLDFEDYTFQEFLWPYFETSKVSAVTSIKNVWFTANDNGHAEPFTTCNMLNTLVLRDCSLCNDAKVLCISNSSLSSLNLENTFLGEVYKIVLSTPNLTSFTMVDYYGYRELSSTCNLSFLEEVNMNICSRIDYSVIISWLHVLSNVKIMTLSSGTLKIILNALSNLARIRTQLPCFVRLESLKVCIVPSAKMSDEEVNRIVEYLFQNSSLTRVDVENWI